MVTNEELWFDFETEALQGLTKKRKDKLKGLFVRILHYFNNKELHSLSKDEIKKFIIDLDSDNFKKITGANYSSEYKADFKKFLKQLFKATKGNGETYPEEVSWIKTKIPKDKKPLAKEALSYDDVVKLANSFQNQEYKVFTLVLFDSGYRLEEGLSIRKKDLTWEKFDDNNYCFWVICNESKTITRKVPIPLFTEELEFYVNSSYVRTLKPGDLLFPMTRNAYQMALRRHSLKMLNKGIGPHILRHSSATYYYGKTNGDSKLMCDRYGWSYSSPMLARYAKQDSNYQAVAARRIFQNSIGDNQKEIDELKKKINNIEKNFESKMYILSGLMQDPEKFDKITRAIKMINKKPI